MISEWLGRRHYGGQWNQLRNLSLGGETLTRENGRTASENMHFDGLLSPTQYKAIIENADSILRLNALDRQLRNTVYALLLSIADFRDYSEFFNQMSRESYCAVKLAPLGRLLTPEFDRKTAFVQLPDEVRNLLNDIFKKKTKSSIELFTGTNIPLDDETCKYWNNEVDSCIMLFNNFIHSHKKTRK